MNWLQRLGEKVKSYQRHLATTRFVIIFKKFMWVLKNEKIYFSSLCSLLNCLWEKNVFKWKQPFLLILFFWICLYYNSPCNRLRNFSKLLISCLFNNICNKMCHKNIIVNTNMLCSVGVQVFKWESVKLI